MTQVTFGALEYEHMSSAFSHPEQACLSHSPCAAVFRVYTIQQGLQHLPVRCELWNLRRLYGSASLLPCAAMP